MLRFSTIAFACFFATCLCTNLRADLVLNVDTVNEEYYFSGAATGTPAIEPNQSTSAVRWILGTQDGEGVGHFIFLRSVITDSPSNGNDAFLFPLFDDGFLELTIALVEPVDGQITFTGRGASNTVPFDPFFGDDSTPFWESIIGGTLTPTSGTGFGSISIVDVNAPADVSTVPEPSAFMILAMGSFGLVARRRR